MSRQPDARPGETDPDALCALARDVGAWTGEDVLERARRYVSEGRVRALELEPANGALLARVEGRRKTPYKVRIDASAPDPRFACSCPYDGDPLCKHGAAALLAHLRRLEADGPAPEPEARAERRRSARQEAWAIRNVGPERYLSAFEVEGESGQTYTVEIRDPGGPVNRCTCLDHRTNLLGTCKHIEAVLEKLRRRAPVKMERLAGGPPPFGQLLVRWDGPPRIVLRMPRSPSAALRRFRRRHFDAEGLLRVHRPEVDGDGGSDGGRDAFLAKAPRVLRQAERIEDLRVYDDVRKLLDAEREAARRATASANLEARLREDALHADRLGIEARLYPYQSEGVAFLACRGRAILADDMGLGKTLQALAAFALLRRRGLARRALVICPASLKHQWQEEAQRFTGFSVEVVEGPPHERQARYRRRADLTVVNYEVVLRDRDVLGAELGADLLILDEAQRIRNWRTKTAAAVKELSGDHAFILTGTPLENRLEDLYSLMQVVDPDILGPLWSFRHRYTVTDPESGGITGYRNLHELRRRLEPLLLRRTRAEVLDDLPGLVVNRFRLDLTEEQRRVHDEAEQEIGILAAIARRRKLRPEEEQRLLLLLNIARMACNAASLLDKEWWQRDHSPEVMLDEALRWPKLRELRRILGELCVDEAKKVVVFSEWRRMQRLAEAVAAELSLGPVCLHGGVPARQRGKLIARFRDDAACSVFLSTDAGGVGLNLQAADAVVVLDLPWNPAVLAQRVARVHRHGQRGSVHVLQLTGRGCLEERLERLLEGKQALFDAALGASGLTEMPRPSTSARMVGLAMEAYGVPPRMEPEAAPPPQKEAASAATPAPALGAVRETAPSPGAAPAPASRHRGFADRQLEAAEVLAAAGLGGPSLVSIHAAARAEMLGALDNLGDEKPPEEPAHDWLVERLHRRLVPERISLEDASLLGQARDLAAAFGSSSSVPAGLAEPLLERLQTLRDRLRRP